MKQLKLIFDKHCDKSAYLSRYAEKKVKRLLRLSGPRDLSVVMRCSVHKGLHKVSVKLLIGGIKPIVCSRTRRDMYEVVASLTHDLSTQIRKAVIHRSHFERCSLTEALTQEERKAA